jgi:hypothetical protein
MPLDYSSIELTEEELKEAILEGKRKKYFREKHRDDWKHDPDEQDRQEMLAKAGQQLLEDNERNGCKG